MSTQSKSRKMKHAEVKIVFPPKDLDDLNPEAKTKLY